MAPRATDYYFLWTALSQSLLSCPFKHVNGDKETHEISDKVAFTLLWFIRRLSAALRFGFSASSRLVADLRTALWAIFSFSLLLRRERVVSLKKRNQLRGFNIFSSSRFTCSKHDLSLSKLTRPAASSSFWLFCHHFMPARCRELLEQLRE